MDRFVRWTAILALMLSSGCAKPLSEQPDGKVLRLPIRAYVKTADPVRCQTKYENQIVSLMYETLVQYKYLNRPLALEPLLLEEMPVVSKDRLTYHFKLKPGVYFHADPCSEGGQGRELVANDVFYSWKRLADNSNLPKGWWLLDGKIKGFDEYRAIQNAARLNEATVTIGEETIVLADRDDVVSGEFNYDAPVQGMEVLGDHEFKVTLNEPIQSFQWILAMPQTSIVPREAAERYGSRFSLHPVGTGPYMLAEEDWVPNLSMTLHAHPHYHDCFYPTEHEPGDEEYGFDKPAGQKLPIVERVELRMFGTDQPMWLSFMTGQIDYTEVPNEYYREVYVKRQRDLRPAYKNAGYVAHDVPLLDFIFRGFNMTDPVLGAGHMVDTDGDGEPDEYQLFENHEKNKFLRIAISLATDEVELNETFYNGMNVVYDGPIPPGLDGFPKGGTVPHSYRGPDLPRARQFLAKAGYASGADVPPIEYYTSENAINQEMGEMFQRQLAKIGVRVNLMVVDFPTLMQTVDGGNAQMFGFAWGSDYPDAENNLALFYSKNWPPGSNHFRYRNLEFDAMYEKIRSMPPSPERTRIYVKMRDLLLEEVPYIGSMARTRNFIVSPRLKNFKPTEDFYNWVKYLDVEENQEADTEVIASVD